MKTNKKSLPPGKRQCHWCKAVMDARYILPGFCPAAGGRWGRHPCCVSADACARREAPRRSPARTPPPRSWSDKHPYAVRATQPAEVTITITRKNLEKIRKFMDRLVIEQTALQFVKSAEIRVLDELYMLFKNAEYSK